MKRSVAGPGTPGAILRDIRCALGWSCADLAARVPCNDSSVWIWETMQGPTGDQKFLPRCRRLCQVLVDGGAPPHDVIQWCLALDYAPPLTLGTISMLYDMERADFSLAASLLAARASSRREMRASIEFLREATRRLRDHIGVPALAAHAALA